MKTYGEHRFLRRELGDFGVQILSLFRREEAVEIVLTGVDGIRDGALEGACHPAETASYQVCHLGWV